MAVLTLLGCLWTRLPEPITAPVASAPLAVDVNRASLDALCALPGVGRKTAAALIAGRPYADWQQVEARLGRARLRRCRRWLRLELNPSAPPRVRPSARSETAR